MLRKILCTENPEADRELVADYRALYSGGKRFRARIDRFLPQNEREPAELYELRKKSARYRSYLGPIVNYFAALLMSSPCTARAKKGDVAIKEPDKWYEAWKEDCDGAGTDLDDFIRGRVADALVGRRSWFRLELPSDGGQPPASREDWEQRNLGNVRLVPVESETVLDWSIGDDLQLDYVVVYAVKSERRDPRQGRATSLHEWRIYDRTKVETYSVAVANGEKPPEDIPLRDSRLHGWSEVPFVCLDVEDHFWIANQIGDAQIEHFALSAGLGWAIRRTCYAMPVFKLEPAPDGSMAGPTMGPGYWLQIGAKDAVDYLAPPSGPFTVIREEIKTWKDEIYRLVHQMALGVENNAGTVGRSGQSKLADAEAVKVILTSLGELVRCVIERTYDLASAVRGDDLTWSIDGLDVYSDVDVETLIAAIAEAMTLDIPSPTFHREVKARAALALVASSDQKTKDAIREEIQKNVSDEDVLREDGEGSETDGADQPAPSQGQRANGDSGDDHQPGAVPNE